MANVVELSIPKSNSKIPVNTGLFINNEFVPSVDNLDPIKYMLRLDPNHQQLTHNLISQSLQSFYRRSHMHSHRR
ncbi:hypothetical protein H4582DRAFT_504539 [Lactarius indigo]|nr:hypothetical protein H4582DRAFT_504539 [Lactarius indigo]